MCKKFEKQDVKTYNTLSIAMNDIFESWILNLPCWFCWKYIVLQAQRKKNQLIVVLILQIHPASTELINLNFKCLTQ